MTRRSLLAMLALAVADPERLIWRPGKKLISIPRPVRVPQWYLDMIHEHALRSLCRQLRFKSDGIERHYVLNETPCMSDRRPPNWRTAAW